MITKHGYIVKDNTNTNEYDYDNDDNPKKEVLIALSEVLGISKKNIIGNTNTNTNTYSLYCYYLYYCYYY